MPGIRYEKVMPASQARQQAPVMLETVADKDLEVVVSKVDADARRIGVCPSWLFWRRLFWFSRNKPSKYSAGELHSVTEFSTVDYPGGSLRGSPTLRMSEPWEAKSAD